MLFFLLLLTSSKSFADDDIFLWPMISEGMDPVNQTFFEMEEDHERLCGVEGRLLKESGNKLVKCSSDDDCLPPSQCHTTGYCCMIALHQEPPPVGCPIGTRSLVNSSGQELTCSPSVPDSCPGGALCYTDSLTNVKRCCGTDPGRGCPSGSRVLLTVLEKPMLCIPGKAGALCPRGALCQWSHLIDRYQCCEPDNGCPRHQAPLRTFNEATLACSPQGPPCPGGAGCHFNFWTASYQCCKLDTADLCPAGLVPLLAESNGEPKSCKQSMDCPSGYHCAENSICCGSPGTCPDNNQPTQDKFGRLTACTSRNGNTCPAGSQCMATDSFSQMLCCEQIEYTCPGYSTPYPSSRFPQKCNLAEPWLCGDRQCMPSNIPNVNICCQSTIIRQREANPCPNGWAPNDDVITYCTPSHLTSSCPGFSSCLRSSDVQQQFLCCVPTMAATARDSCIDPMATVELVQGTQRKCLPNTNSCSYGFSCQPSKRNGWLCCSVGLARAQFTCPFLGQQPVLTQQGGNQFCSRPGTRLECPRNALCVSTGNSDNINICCISAAAEVNPVCPNNGIPQASPTGYRSCSVNSMNDCDPGYTCARATNNFSIQLCCSTGSATEPVCPNQGYLLKERGRPVYCSANQPHLCPVNYPCESAVGAPGTYVCCSSPTTTISCPARYTPSLDRNGNKIVCSPSSTFDCPDGSSCRQSLQTPSVHLCCKDDRSPRLCPNNRNAYIGPFGTVETCAGPGLRCSQVGYTCQYSANLTQFVCCSDDPTPAYCADGRNAFQQIAGETYSCNPGQFPSSCPVGYECAQSTLPHTSVCCAKSVDTPITLPPPPSNTQCPPGFDAYRNDVDRRERSCSGPLDNTCPTRYSCAPSMVFRQFLCCRPAISTLCVQGSTFLVNNNPRLCIRNQPNQCPRGYTCEQSIIPSVAVCCSGAARPERTLCPDGRSPSLLNGFIRSCPVENQAGGCPNGSTCQRATSGMLVCCSSTPSTADVCPQNRQPIFSQVTNDYVYCDETAFTCAGDHSCLPMVKSERYVCCSAVPKCTQGTPEMYLIGRVKRCSTSSDCGRGFLCTESNVGGVHVCCSSGAMPAGDVKSRMQPATPISTDTLVPSLTSKVNVAKIDEEEWVVIEG